MPIDRVRSFEAEPAGAPRERASGKASDFSALMQSVLGPAGEPPSAAAEAREARASRGENTSPGRDARPAAPSSRKPARGEKKDETTSEPAVADDGALRSESGVVEAASEGEPEEREVDASAAAIEAELLAGASMPAWEAAAPLAVPGLEAVARSVNDDASRAAAETVQSVAAMEERGGSGLDAPQGPAIAPEEIALAEATGGRSVLADPKARAGFLAALQQARSAGDEASAAVGDEAVAVDAAPADAEPRIPGERAGASREAASEARGLATDVPRAAAADPASRSAVDSSTLGSTPVRREGAPSGSDRGSEESPGRRGNETPQPAPMPVERASAESRAVASAAIEGATAGVAETTPGSPETSASLRIEVPAPAPPARAPEPTTAMQPGRTLPTAAPDAIAIQADWLATRGGGTARLVLNPPELGEIAIRVTVRQQAVEVVMVAQTALAHSMAEDQGDRLSQAFASRDLRLEQFEVRRGDPGDSSGTGQFGSSDAGTRERERAQDDREVDRGGFGGAGPHPSGRAAESVAPAPRIGSKARAAGIDLRI